MAYLQTLNFMNIYMLGGAVVAGAAGDGPPPSPPNRRGIKDKAIVSEKKAKLKVIEKRLKALILQKKETDEKLAKETSDEQRKIHEDQIKNLNGLIATLMSGIRNLEDQKDVRDESSSPP